MLEMLNRVFVFLLLLIALGGIALSIIALFLPDLLGDGFGLEYVRSMNQTHDFVLIGENVSITPTDSPYLINYTVLTPPLGEFDQLYVEVYSEGKLLVDGDCLYGYYDYEDRTEFNCTAIIPYYYNESQSYLVFATLYTPEYEVASGPLLVEVQWNDYEDLFWEISFLLIILVGAVCLFIVFPLTLAIAYIASKMKHPGSKPGDYTIFSLLNPFTNSKTLLQKFNSFLISPYFWIFEIIGIFIILIYLLLSAEVWKSTSALFAFFLSGIMAIIVPYLWCVAWWYADFREREPLRILVTFFLWGMLSALMAIGINSFMGIALEIVGLGFLLGFLVAPLVEELYKGTGVALLAEHREFNSIEDGVVFGFIVGMGFSFVEDWIYLLSTPMGSDIFWWFSVFMLRSILFSANHGLYTAIVGGVIGLLIERGFKAPALGLLVGLPIAAFFHAVHNSGELLAFLFGEGGLLAYCCILVPLFDYGGLLLLIFLFIWALFRKKR